MINYPAILERIDRYLLGSKKDNEHWLNVLNKQKGLGLSMLSPWYVEKSAASLKEYILQQSAANQRPLIVDLDSDPFLSEADFCARWVQVMLETALKTEPHGVHELLDRSPVVRAFVKEPTKPEKMRIHWPDGLGLDAVLELPRILTETTKRPLFLFIYYVPRALFIDEWSIKPTRLQSLLDTQNVHLLFYDAESISSTLEFGQIPHLKKVHINESRWFKWIQKFASKTLEQQTLIQLIKELRFQPKPIMACLRILHSYNEPILDLSMVQKVLQQWLAEEYANKMELLNTLSDPQRGFLKAVAHNEHKLFSKEVIQRYNMGSSAHVAKIKRQFMQKNWISTKESTLLINDIALHFTLMNQPKP